MARPLRNDHPGALHHVTNRGHGHRALFDGEGDVRVFLGLLARAVQEGVLEVHAYSVLATHFHLIVGSKDGTIAVGMGWVEDLYARYFNRTRERDGHAFKSRYFARRIDDPAYLAMAVTYVDGNAVVAGLVAHPAAYAYGSAKDYVTDGGCPWLRREVIEDLACRVAGARRFTPEAYTQMWRACQPLGTDALVAQAVRSPRAPVAPILRLLCSGPRFVQEWLLQCAMAEEGRRGIALAVHASQFGIVERCLPAELCRPGPAGRSRDMSKPLRAAMMRVLCGLTTQEIAARTSVSAPMVVRWIQWHREALSDDPEYARLASRVVTEAVRNVYGGLASIAMPPQLIGETESEAEARGKSRLERPG